MRRLARAAAPAAVLLAATAFVAACRDPVAPTYPRYLLLSGVFTAASVPGGSAVRIATTASGGEINGIGVVYVSTGTDSLEIGGQYLDDGTFGLSIAFASGRQATFTGRVTGAANITGTWIDWTLDLSVPATFVRALVPPCADSVPLLGMRDPDTHGFLVLFRDDVDSREEAARLASLYGFAATAVYGYAAKGFAADLPLETVTVLRCEPSVASVTYFTSRSGNY